jgi:hypothetical protein
MGKLRTLLTATALVLLTAVSLAAAVRTYMLGIPEPLNPDRSPLVNLLSTRKVTDQPMRSQRSVAQQVERELRRGTEWLAEVEQLDDVQRVLFADNVAELAKIAFLDKADAYAMLQDQHSKERYLDRQIELILGWAAVFRENPQLTEKALSGPGSVVVVLAKIGQWRQQADARQRRRIAAFQTALRDHFLTRMSRPMRADLGW